MPLSVDEACHIVLAAVEPLPVVDLPLAEALGLVLANDIRANIDVPPFRNSAMDGFAVRAADTQGAGERTPVHLRISDEIAAGTSSAAPVTPGHAARIMTGAPLPAGADAVVRFEDTLERGPNGGAGRGQIEILVPVSLNENVRHAGEDIAAGTMVLAAGAVVTPAAIGVLASVNQALVPVHRRPRVAILSTGNEVVDVGRPLRPGEIRDSNGYLLAALVARSGGVPVRLGIADDSPGSIERHLAAARDADFILTSGGVSVGDYDLVKDVLRRAGEIEIWQVAMKPGKPLAFGRLDGVPLLGLPGNPLAAAVGFEVFARPGLRKLMGRRRFAPVPVWAKLMERIENGSRRELFVPARLAIADRGELVVRPIGKRGAGMLSPLLAANGLVSLAASEIAAEAGTSAQVRPFSDDDLLERDGEVPA